MYVGDSVVGLSVEGLSVVGDSVVGVAVVGVAVLGVAVLNTSRTVVSGSTHDANRESQAARSRRRTSAVSVQTRARFASPVVYMCLRAGCLDTKSSLCIMRVSSRVCE